MKEWMIAERIAGTDEHLAAVVPDAQSKMALDTPNRVWPPLSVGSKDELRAIRSPSRTGGSDQIRSIVKYALKDGSADGIPAGADRAIWLREPGSLMAESAVATDRQREFLRI